MKQPDTQLLDTSGLYCPEPIMLLHEKMDALSVGESLCLICTDPTAERDVKRFCQFLGHTLVSSEVFDHSEQTRWQFVIQKSDGNL